MKTTICTAVAGMALMLLGNSAYAAGPVVLVDEQLDTVVASGINLHHLEDQIEAAIIQALGPKLGPIADKIEDAITSRVNI